MTANTAPAPAAHVVAHLIGDSSRIMLLGSYESIEAAHARANRIRPTVAGLVIAPVVPAYVAARRVVSAL